ncbi:MAG TPA: phasin family protein [Casimicrobiaceae bacterium]|nr:phasin family protein [Casimicrobiaceae bacterium]
MARKRAATSPSTAAKTAAKTATKRRAKRRTSAKSAAPAAASTRATTMQMPDLRELAKMPKIMTPEQAIDLYKTNAKMALDVINAAIDSAARLRKKQFEGEEQMRAFQQKHARAVGQASDAQSLMAASQGAATEAVERSMHYWGEVFDLIVEIQKRLFALIEEQMAGVPGVKEAKAAMAMMPDLRQMKDVVSAMQGVVTSGGSAFDTMQKMMGDFTKMAQGSMQPMRR